jgi:hypothetical protein
MPWVCAAMKHHKHISSVQVCRLAPSGKDFQFEGESGAGVDNADFILYVSTQSLARCNIGSTVAYAAFCQLEPALDRYNIINPLSCIDKMMLLSFEYLF